MNGRELLEAMSFLDEELIAASEAPMPKPQWQRWGALAACVALLMACSFAWLTLGRGGAKEAADEAACQPETWANAAQAPESALNVQEAPAAGAEAAPAEGSAGPDAGEREAVTGAVQAHVLVYLREDGTALVLESRNEEWDLAPGRVLTLTWQQGTAVPEEPGNYRLWLESCDSTAGTAVVDRWEAE